MNKILIFLTLSVALLGASSIKQDSPIYKFRSYKFETPHGRQMKIPKKTNLIIVAFDKDTGALVNDFLKTKNKYYLQKNNTIYIADIHKMPSIVTTMFALPKLKKHKHLIYLHYGDKLQKDIPNQEGKVTILRFVDGKVSDISFLITKEELQAAIER